MRKFMIEREIPGVGQLDSCGLAEAARKSNAVLAELGPGIQWQQSFVTGDRTYCVYLAESEDLIRVHAEKSGFPATRITEITGLIDPSTALR
jgi:Nickel responsive protein SCO4226-like